jgi:sulfate adenylyltransferase subunit 2
MYFAQAREVVARGPLLIPVIDRARVPPGQPVETVTCRFRTLGCWPCTGAIRSDARTVRDIIQEMMVVRHSERITRVIDHDQDSSMEQKKREGYF